MKHRFIITVITCRLHNFRSAVDRFFQRKAPTQLLSTVQEQRRCMRSQLDETMEADKQDRLLDLKREF